jgi:rare lipoprotein A
MAEDSLLIARPGLVREKLALTGIAGGESHRPRVEVQISQSDGSWATIARARASRSGSFRTSWRPLSSGRFTLRAVTAGASASSTATATVSVMRRTVATWYDQAGSTTACDVDLEKDTLGVAHRSLPCGTVLEFSFRGRSVTTPVIDRGPFVKGVSYDLTIAAAREIRFVSTGRGTVGVLPAATPLSAPAPAPGLAAGHRR